MTLNEFEEMTARAKDLGCNTFGQLNKLFELYGVKNNEEKIELINQLYLRNKGLRKWLFTFGVGTHWAGKAVVIITDDLQKGIEYVFEKYGRHNVAFNYLWEDKGKELVKKYNYEIIEEVEL